MVYFVGAGPGDPDLITVKGKALLEAADTVIYAGSLVNPKLLEYCRAGCEIYNSAHMTLEQVILCMEHAYRDGKTIIRLHTGDPSIYGAIREQIDELKRLSIPYEVVPGVSSFCGAAAALHAEYTLPGVSQSVIITRLAGKTPVPVEEDLAELAKHGASMAIFLSAGMVEKVCEKLLQGKYTVDTPCAIVYKATWPEEMVFRTNLGKLADCARENEITKTALILVGDFLGQEYDRSLLYDPGFTTEYRKGIDV